MAPIAVERIGLQNFHVLRFSLNVPGLGLTSQLFSMAIILNCFPANLIKENIKSLQCHLNLFSDTNLVIFASGRINL